MKQRKRCYRLIRLGTVSLHIKRHVHVLAFYFFGVLLTYSLSGKRTSRPSNVGAVQIKKVDINTCFIKSKFL